MTKKTANTKVREPETANTKKAAKAVSGKTAGEGKAVKAAKVAKPKGPTIGSRAIELLKGGTSAKETLATIQQEFKGCKTSMACIYWYANHNGVVLQKKAAPKTAPAKKAAQPVAAAA